MGRPDMSYFKFTDQIVNGRPIQIYNMGDMKRDFTYIDDIVKGIRAVMGQIPEPCSSGARYSIFNIGNSSPVALDTFITTLERILWEEGVTTRTATHQLLPMQLGDVYQTYADTTALEQKIGYQPSTTLEHGLRSFARWYRDFYSDRV